MLTLQTQNFRKQPADFAMREGHQGKFTSNNQLEHGKWIDKGFDPSNLALLSVCL
ncbi:hypothetical protein C1H46_017794 [Malus baccata]|uniref:Uncharacterized protein n=1 Tax=Malus baccata TaxID=106549 RepID=A0A540MD08_MALBA|nr:hypothetical protein C1H46_017794 [Malus baccata]